MADDKTKPGIQQTPAGVPSSPIRFPRPGADIMGRSSAPDKFINHSCNRPMVAVRFIRDGEPLGTEERGWRCQFCDYQRTATEEEAQHWEAARGFSGGRGIDVKIPTVNPKVQPEQPAQDPPAADEGEAETEKPATMPIPKNEEDLRKMMKDHPHLRESADRLLSTLQGVTEGAPAPGTWVCPTCEKSNPLPGPVDDELVVECACGKRAEINVYAVGDPMKLTCPPCSGSFEVAREKLPEEEGDILELSCPNCEAKHELRRENSQIRWVPPALSTD